jgi:predicted phosphoribosyltransferase/dienelactone hydrolase
MDMDRVSHSSVRIPFRTVELHGDLRVPDRSSGLVLFAHGSGSSRHSSRNRYVARVLEESGLATLLMDLLTEQEEALDARTRHLRFDIPFLAERVVAATNWVQGEPRTRQLSIGYFGASTGAAAALVAAAERPAAVRAVVSRGGRPDLAMAVMPRVTQPTLLIVGGADFPVIDVNRHALAALRAEKRLEIVPGATHLFEEPGALEAVAGLARDWFDKYLIATHAAIPSTALPGGRYRDRGHAGQVLATRLAEYAGRGDVLVLALPRGGVPVGFEVAKALGAPLDVFLVRKLGVPGHEEFAFGAIASGGVRVLNEDVVRELGIPAWMIEAVAAREGEELARRERQYRGTRPAPDVRDRGVILVDDGLATGASMRAAAVALRHQGAARIVVAVPIGAPQTCDAFRDQVDDVVCAITPEPFHAVGLWYDDFSQTSDEEVRDLLRRAEREIARAA